MNYWAPAIRSSRMRAMMSRNEMKEPSVKENHSMPDTDTIFRTLAGSIQPDVEKIRTGVEQAIREELQNPSPQRPFQSFAPRWAYATGLLLALVFVSYLIVNQNNKIDPFYYFLPLGPARIVSAGETISQPGELKAEGETIETLPNSVASLICVNQYRVRLAQLSSIHVVDPNQIRLEKGSLFAQVEKRGRSSKPFSVQAGDLTVQVLGTQFSVEWLDDRIQVAVREGSVRVVSRQGEEKILNASECVSFQNDKIGQSQPIAPEQIAPWSRSLIREETSNQHLRRLMREYFPSRTF